MVRRPIWLLVMGIMALGGLSWAGTVEDVYHEEYDRLTADIARQEKLIVVMSDYNDTLVRLKREENEIVMRDRMARGTKADNLRALIDVKQRKVDVGTQFISDMARIKGVSESEVGGTSFSRDMAEAKERRLSLTDKKRGLKLKVVEKLNVVPEWWKD